MTSRRAETVSEIGVYPMRRKDRLALQLAYSACRDMEPQPETGALAVPVIRSSQTTMAFNVGGDVAFQILEAFDGPEMRIAQPKHERRLRLARLALLLRVLLKVDAGDYGPVMARWWCRVCGPTMVWSAESGPKECVRCCEPCSRTRRIAPLWEIAPRGTR